MALYGELIHAPKDGPLSDESTGASQGEIIRDYQPKEGVTWRFGRPNYARVNNLYFSKRSMKPAEGSLEAVVTKVVKNWEVDTHHVAKVTDWQTVDRAAFRVSVNGGPKLNAQMMADIGPYNALIGDIPGTYDASKQTFESANKIFSEIFTEGFALEILEVYSGPPVVNFKWRHFGPFSGKYTDPSGREIKGDGRMVELFGMCIARLTESLLITDLELFYNPLDNMRPITGDETGGLKPQAGQPAGTCFGRPATEKSVQG
jgi:hypothetical protein